MGSRENTGFSPKIWVLFILLSMTSSCIGTKSSTIFFNAQSSPELTCTGGPYSIAVSWNANREKAVNMAGGGYLVYYSTSSPVNTSTASYVDVPYVSGATAPTSTMITGLSCGKWYFAVVAYSALHPSGSSSGSRSIASSEVAVTVP
jgi:hypothetical protein